MPETEQIERHAVIARRLWVTFQEDGPGGLSIAASSLRPADVASALAQLDPEQRAKVFLALPAELAGQVLEAEDPELRDELLAAADDRRLLEILGSVDADDAVYFLDHLDESRAVALLTRMDERLRQQLAEQYELPEDSAGRLMTRDVAILRSFMTAGQALDLLRSRDRPHEGYLYVVDARSRLAGVLGLRTLVRADPRTVVGQLMDREPMTVGLDTDQEEVVELMQRYHLRAVPVVDAEGHLCGQVTWDDAIDAMEAEANEDILALAGTGEDLEENAGVVERARKRLPYLLVTAIGGFVMANLIEGEVDRLSALPLLIGFLPLVPALGGNIGIQCSTVTLRSIATGELTPRRVMSRTMRELATGLTLAVLLSVICGLGAMAIVLITGQDVVVGAIIGVAMLLAIVVAAAIGVFVPLACMRMGIDPAIAAGPFITMLNDVSGVGIYLATATLMLGALA